MLANLLSYLKSQPPNLRLQTIPLLRWLQSLGVVDMGLDGSFTIADIGLIEGAADGHGLGHQFLRHVQRTKTLLHLLSLGPDEALDVVDRYQNIRREDGEV